MLSLRQELLGKDGLDGRERLELSGQGVEMARIGEARARCAVGKRILRVLVVDDNRDCADSLARLIHLWGNEVQTTYDGAAALAMTLRRHLDVMLLDLSVPMLDGYQVARQLRRTAAFAAALLVAVTGRADKAHHQCCDAEGFDDYLEVVREAPLPLYSGGEGLG